MRGFDDNYNRDDDIFSKRVNDVIDKYKKAYVKPPKNLDDIRQCNKEEFDAVNNEIKRLITSKNYTGAFNYSMKIKFYVMAKKILEEGVPYYKNNNLFYSHAELLELGKKAIFEKDDDIDITDKLK